MPFSGISSCTVESVTLPVAVAVASGAESACGVYAAVSTTGCRGAPNVLFIIHYSLPAHAQFQK